MAHCDTGSTHEGGKTYCMRGSRNFCQGGGGPGPTASVLIFYVIECYVMLEFSNEI